MGSNLWSKWYNCRSYNVEEDQPYTVIHAGYDLGFEKTLEGCQNLVQLRLNIRTEPLEYLWMAIDEEQHSILTRGHILHHRVIHTTK